jgi:SAM-dependent methyltransferase
MNRETILALNKINRDFYTHRAEEFVATRRRPWRGWLRLLEPGGKPFGDTPLSVLDVGCGNGRFALFLKEHLRSPFRYVGIEFSPGALEHARERLADLPSVTLIQHDVTAGVPDSAFPPEIGRGFSLITLFGFLHHVPAYTTRQALLFDLAVRLAPDGILAFSVWQFGRFERFRKKILPWEELVGATDGAVDPGQLEPGDHLLSWGDVRPAQTRPLDSSHRFRSSVSTCLPPMDVPTTSISIFS